MIIFLNTVVRVVPLYLQDPFFIFRLRSENVSDSVCQKLNIYKLRNLLDIPRQKDMRKNYRLWRQVTDATALYEENP